ncbi:MAG: hypothetical protein ACFFDF_19790 [Candidatus Odinarchaeota archaeon]
MQEVKSKKITSGTKEWSDSSVNCFYGCPNNCGYCYAKKSWEHYRKKRGYPPKKWDKPEPNFNAINKGYKKRKGRIMFPTSHDITLETLEYCLIVLEKLLKSGNEVLITTKPDPHCIMSILNKFEQYKSQIQFRFTITSRNKKRLTFWEPNAPSYIERLDSLFIAFHRGFKTSVSIEPFLDKNPLIIIEKLAPYITESIWVGVMNYIKAEGITDREKPYYNYQRKISSWFNVQKIVENLKLLPEEIKSKIRFKDTLRNKGFSIQSIEKERKR